MTTANENYEAKLRMIGKHIFAKGTVPDGYFGDRASVAFSLFAGKVWLIDESGLILRCAMDKMCIDAREALWQLQHDPWASRNIRITSVA